MQGETIRDGKNERKTVRENMHEEMGESGGEWRRAEEGGGGERRQDCRSRDGWDWSLSGIVHKDGQLWCLCPPALVPSSFDSGSKVTPYIQISSGAPRIVLQNRNNPMAHHQPKVL